jgi:hypothetical protein
VMAAAVCGDNGSVGDTGDGGGGCVGDGCW